MKVMKLHPANGFNLSVMLFQRALRVHNSKISINVNRCGDVHTIMISAWNRIVHIMMSHNAIPLQDWVSLNIPLVFGTQMEVNV